MSLTEWLETNIKKMKWYDVPLLKFSVLFATLFLITVWTGFRTFVLSIAWYWYLVLMLICMAPLLKKIFFD